LALAQGGRPRPRRDFAKRQAPVCKLLDFGKYKFPRAEEAGGTRKKQKIGRNQGSQFRPMIDDHDYDVKMRS